MSHYETTLEAYCGSGDCRGALDALPNGRYRCQLCHAVYAPVPVLKCMSATARDALFRCADWEGRGKITKVEDGVG